MGRPWLLRSSARPPRTCSQKQAPRGATLQTQLSLRGPEPSGGSGLVVSVVSSSSPLFPGRGGSGRQEATVPTASGPSEASPEALAGPPQRGRPGSPQSALHPLSFLGPSAQGSAPSAKAQHCGPTGDKLIPGLQQCSARGPGPRKPQGPLPKGATLLPAARFPLQDPGRRERPALQRPRLAFRQVVRPDLRWPSSEGPLGWMGGQEAPRGTAGSVLGPVQLLTDPGCQAVSPSLPTCTVSTTFPKDSGLLG